MPKALVLIHLLVASFIAPAFLLVATSGGLYLLGIKGEMVSSAIELPAEASLDFTSNTLDQDVRRLLQDLRIDYEFEYIKNRGKVIQTRPTSKKHIEFKSTASGVIASWQDPSLQKSMIELHKGHGPQAFKTYQKFVALALLCVVVTGSWMGIASPTWRRKTMLTSAIGLVLFLLLALS